MRIVRFKFADGRTADVPAEHVMAVEHEQRAFVRSAKGGLASGNSRRNPERDALIASEDLFLRLALGPPRDTRELAALLAQLGHGDPAHKFKAHHIAALLAKRYGLTERRVRGILKNWKRK